MDKTKINTGNRAKVLSILSREVNLWKPCAWVCNRTSMSTSAVRKHLESLVTDGLAEKLSDERGTAYRAI